MWRRTHGDADGVVAGRCTFNEIAAIAGVFVDLVIGTVLSVTTFSANEALADAVSAGLLTWIDDHLVSFGIDVAVLTSNLGEAGEMISDVLVSVINAARTAAPVVTGVVGAGIGAGYQGSQIVIGDLIVNNAIAEAFGQQQTDGTAALEAIVTGTWQNAVAGGVSETAGTLSASLIQLGEKGGSQMLINPGRQLKAGSISVQFASQQIVQWMDPGQLNSVGLISNAVGNRLTIAVGPNTGSHASDDFPSLGS